MDSFTMVAEGIDAGKEFLAALRREGVTVDLVFWHRSDEAAPWSFCVATPINPEEGSLGAIRRVVAVRRSFGNCCTGHRRSSKITLPMRSPISILWAR